jgi:hypothetical protein
MLYSVEFCNFPAMKWHEIYTNIHVNEIGDSL